MTTHIPTDTVRDAARGQWLSILGGLAPDLSQALQRVGRHVPCPVHGGQDGFRLFRDAEETGGGICNTCGEFSDGFALLMWRNGWDFPEAKRAIADYLRLEPGSDRTPPPIRRTTTHRTEPTEQDIQARRDKLVELWKGTKSDNGLIAAYLKSRGLYLPAPQDLRLHPNLDYYHDGQLLGTYPAMIARVQTLDGTRVSIHRTYLAPDGSGKATVPSPKKLMTPIKDGALLGAAIRLTEAGEILGLAEGIETALAIREACKMEEFDLPIWATVTAGGMEAVQVPDSVRRVEIWADNDKSGRGQEAAEILAQRMHDAGKEVFVYLPPAVGVDWLDALNLQGHKVIWETRTQGNQWVPPPPEQAKPETTGSKRSATTKRERKPAITARQLSELPAPSFLIQDYVPMGGLTVLYGPSGGGKSFVALDWALSVTSGRPWFAKKVKQGNVLYVAAEGAGGYSKRMLAWERDRAAVKDVFDLPIYFDTEPVHLMEMDDVDRFIALNAHIEPSLVVLDTLARNAGGADENSARDMGRVIDAADRIRKQMQASVVLVHHSGKSGNSERGSGAVRGAADCMVYLTLQDEIILLGVDKAKDSEPPEPISLRLVPVLFSDSCVIGRADSADAPDKLSQKQREALKGLKELGGSASLNRWMQMADKKLGELMPVVNALVAKGYVDEPEKGTKGGKYQMTSEGHGAL